MGATNRSRIAAVVALCILAAVVLPVAVTVSLLIVGSLLAVEALAVIGEQHASDQAERDAIERRVRLLQTTEGAVLHLRRNARVVP